MTIKAIQVEYYQSHEDSVIELSEGLTVLTGASDSGKTSLVRAIKWLLQNRPIGFGFQSHFAPRAATTRVAMEFEEGSYVVRERSSKVNQYSLSTYDKPFKALRTELPDEVTEITQLTEINLQSQHDPYFMLQDSPAVVGSMFNQAVGLEIIDTVISEMMKYIKETRRTLSFRMQENTRKREEIEKYNFLDGVKEVANEVDSLLTRKENMEQKAKDLGEILQEIQDKRKRIDDLETMLSLTGLLTDCRHSADELLARVEIKHRLIGIVDDTKALRSKKKELTNVLRHKDKLAKLRASMEELLDLTSNRISLSRIVRQLKQEHRRLQSTSDDIKQLNLDYVRLLSTLKICPTCKRLLTEETLQQIMERGL